MPDERVAYVLRRGCAAGDDAPAAPAAAAPPEFCARAAVSGEDGGHGRVVRTGFGVLVIVVVVVLITEWVQQSTDSG